MSLGKVWSGSLTNSFSVSIACLGTKDLGIHLPSSYAVIWTCSLIDAHAVFQPEAFAGDELVTWLQENFRDLKTRETALEYGSQLFDEKIFLHVVRPPPLPCLSATYELLSTHICNPFSSFRYSIDATPSETATTSTNSPQVDLLARLGSVLNPPPLPSRSPNHYR
jgi:hypothetical protein